MQLRPREYFTIARGLEDHTDTGTYYVRAVIRNARTDALIDTVDLTDNGNRRFTKAWQVPADTSGEGFYILITTTVYTDSGYTTKSPLYGEKFDTYLVQDRPNPNLGGGGGGVDVDYKKVRAIVRDEIQNIAFPEPVKSVDEEKILGKLEALRKKDPETPIREMKTAVAAIFDELRGVGAAIEGLPQPEKVDLRPILAKLAELQEAVRLILKSDSTEIAEAVNKIAKELARVAEKVDSAQTVLQISTAPTEKKKNYIL